jgi:hypothetical protein
LSTSTSSEAAVADSAIDEEARPVEDPPVGDTLVAER